MDLETTKDIIFARNCVLLKIKQLLYSSNSISPDASNVILSEFNTLLNTLNLSELDKAKNLLDNGTTSEFVSFCKNLKSTPAKDLAQYYLEIISNLLKERGRYSQEKFNELEEAFYKGNEHLRVSDKTTNINELEEEPNSEMQDTNVLPQSLLNMQNLLKNIQASKISADSFQEFCKEYSLETLTFAKEKFQESFNSEHKTLTDLSIAYAYDDDLRHIYSTIFSLLDENSNISTLTFQKPVTYINNYFQSLCHAYLESNKYSQKSLASLKTLSLDQINLLIDKFSKDYKNLTEMSKCKINISKHNNQIQNMFFSVVTEHTPENTVDIVNTTSPISLDFLDEQTLD